MKNKKVLNSIAYIIISMGLIWGNTFISYAANINFSQISNKDGLSQSTAETIIQDKKGYIWIGTNDGLNRYNGYDYKIYRYDQLSKDSIANNYIVDLEEDSDGNIWVGTANGLSKINTSNDKITNYFQEEESGNLSSNNIGDILITKKGDIIVGTSKGMNLYDKKENSFNSISIGDNNLLDNKNIHSLEEDESGNIWVATDNGLIKINLDKKEIKEYSKGNDKYSLSGNNIYGLCYDKGYMWVGTYKDGLNKINLRTNEITKYINDYKDDKTIPGNFIRKIFKDSNNILWIGTDKGLARFNDKEESFTSYKSNSGDDSTIAQDNIFEIIEDNSGMIWVGTYSGISIFDPNSKIIHYKNEMNNANSLSDNVVHGIYEDNQGKVWVGTKSKGVNIIDRKNDKISHLNVENTNNMFSDNSITDIAGKGDYVYIATRNGLNVINLKNKTLRVYDESDGLHSDDIRTLYLDNEGMLWAATPGGISIIDIKNFKVRDITDYFKNLDLDTLYAKVIYQDKEGNYWLGCFIENGLIKINSKTNEVERYRHNKNDKNTINSDSIRNINEDKNGDIWIGTSYGLSRFDKKTKKFINYTTRDGLSNNIIYGIEIDNEGNPWVSTNMGLSKYNIKNDTFENFGVTDGLQGNEFNGNASYKNRTGELFFGGINGLNIFKPEDLDAKKYTPNVEFDDFEVNGKKYSNIDNMEFKHNENFLNITLFLPDYRNTKNIRYFYMLEGANEDWRVAESNDINYNNLSDGEYTLRVKARSYNGLNTDESVVNFKIKPPFYKSTSAIVIYILVGVLIIYSYINRMNYLDRLVKNKTRELSTEMEKSKELLNKVIDLERTKNNYFINLSHELRTPLNVIHTTEQLISEFNKGENGIEKEKLSNHMMVMRRNTKRLLSLINNLIDVTKIEYGKYKINLKPNDIVYVVEEAALSLKEYVESKGIELIIDPEIEEKIIMCDDYEIERCIVNLVSNAAKFTDSGGKIEISIKSVNDKILISVSDTGIGIDKKYHDLVFNRFNQVVDPNSEIKGGSGLGLTITKQIIELHNGTIHLESELNKGSTFTIIL